MPRKKDSFGGRFDSGFKSFSDQIKKESNKYDIDPNKNPFSFEPADRKQISRIRFYNHDSMWNRWRRGYELYTLTQTLFGTSASERENRGDYRLYCSFEQYPGLFIPARLFTYPSSHTESGQQIVVVRDANSFNFYDYGLKIADVRYLQEVKTGTYTQVGSLITVNIENHGYKPGDYIYLKFLTGAGVTTNLFVTYYGDNVFECIDPVTSVTTSGNIQTQKICITGNAFEDPAWVEQRVTIKNNLPPQLDFLVGERLTDRSIERDPGVPGTYAQSGFTVTVSTFADHGLSAGNQVYLEIPAIGTTVQAGLYIIDSVLNSQQFEVTSVASGSASGSLTVERRIPGYNYNDYVGYTYTGFDTDTNELKFQKADSYATAPIDPTTGLPSLIGEGTPKTIVPAHRGFQQGRYLTTEIRYQCSCQDYLKRETYNFYDERQKRRFPNTPAGHVRPGFRLDRDNNLIDTRDDIGVYNSFGYLVVNNFYQIPTYEDTPDYSNPLLAYYQLRWCKHIYATMWSIAHDEGNDKFSFNASYQQSGPVVTVTTDVPHNLEANKRVHLNFKSGNAVDGDYIITQVTAPNVFTVVYPYDQTTNGYCVVENLKLHEYVRTWLLEPNDAPAGESAQLFYKQLEKENGAVKKALERMKMTNYGLPWIGSTTIESSGGQQVVASNFNSNLVTMTITDSIRRDLNNNISAGGVPLNTTTTLLTVLQKALNLNIELIQSAKFGLLSQPLTEYTPDFLSGVVEGGTYINGEPLDLNPQPLDSGTYVNGVPVDVISGVVDCGTYVSN